ncbi:hypothetical protein [Celeribacter sp.]|uniref:hypothetical protein n=1 Tax=Celeribacter sp. TaxID=1890673 RepID=UPI003A8E9804
MMSSIAHLYTKLRKLPSLDRVRPTLRRNNKTIALVTGASRGLDREMALCLADVGHNMMLTYLDNQKMLQARQMNFVPKGAKLPTFSSM